MVSKLLLTAQECFFKAVEEKADKKTIGKLIDHYYEIKAGIGLFKSPELYGAFPTDAYSHTPANAGAKQPGMTGQVKEDVITRFGELGVNVKNGLITFNPILLNKEEALQSAQTFDYYLLDGAEDSIDLIQKQIAFTFCQVPVVYSFSSGNKILITLKDCTSIEVPGLTLNEEYSNEVFSRSGEVKRIDVLIAK